MQTKNICITLKKLQKHIYSKIFTYVRLKYAFNNYIYINLKNKMLQRPSSQTILKHYSIKE